LLPMASMTLATGADLIPSDSTRYARLARGIAFVNNTLYSALFTKSMPNTLLDLTVGATIANSIKRYDVPQSPEGQKVPLWDRLKLYAQNMLACKYMPAFYPAPKIEQPPEQGFKTEEESVVYWNWATRRSLGMAAAAKPPAAQDAPPIHANFDRSTSRAADASDVAADTGMCMPQRRIAIRYDIAA